MWLASWLEPAREPELFYVQNSRLQGKTIMTYQYDSIYISMAVYIYLHLFIHIYIYKYGSDTSNNTLRQNKMSPSSNKSRDHRIQVQVIVEYAAAASREIIVP
jgi:hypothetical protein